MKNNKDKIKTQNESSEEKEKRTFGNLFGLSRRKHRKKYDTVPRLPCPEKKEETNTSYWRSSATVSQQTSPKAIPTTNKRSSQKQRTVHFVIGEKPKERSSSDTTPSSLPPSDESSSRLSDADTLGESFPELPAPPLDSDIDGRIKEIFAGEEKYTGAASELPLTESQIYMKSFVDKLFNPEAPRPSKSSISQMTEPTLRKTEPPASKPTFQPPLGPPPYIAPPPFSPRETPFSQEGELPASSQTKHPSGRSSICSTYSSISTGELQPQEAPTPRHTRTPTSYNQMPPEYLSEEDGWVRPNEEVVYAQRGVTDTWTAIVAPQEGGKQKQATSPQGIFL